MELLNGTFNVLQVSAVSYQVVALKAIVWCTSNLIKVTKYGQYVRIWNHKGQIVNWQLMLTEYMVSEEIQLKVTLPFSWRKL